MLETLLRHLNNWFLVPDGVHTGTFVIENGSISLPFLASEQYFRIVGSIFNDGLHRSGAQGLVDETFEGAIWALAIPNAVRSLADEIENWQEKYGQAAASPYQSESFGGYSYTKAGAGKSGSSSATSWQEAFKDRLNCWRKINGVEP